MRKWIAAAAVGAAMMVAGCGHITGGVSPSNVPLASGSYSELGPVSGSDCVYYLLGLIPLSDGNETITALQDALAQKPDTSALVNITSDTFSQYFILFSRVCTQVDGVAVKAK